MIYRSQHGGFPFGTSTGIVDFGSVKWVQRPPLCKRADQKWRRN